MCFYIDIYTHKEINIYIYIYIHTYMSQLYNRNILSQSHDPPSMPSLINTPSSEPV